MGTLDHSFSICFPPQSKWSGQWPWTLSPNESTLNLFHVRRWVTVTREELVQRMTIKGSSIFSESQKRPVENTSVKCYSETFHPWNNFIIWTHHGLFWRLHNKLWPTKINVNTMLKKKKIAEVQHQERWDVHLLEFYQLWNTSQQLRPWETELIGVLEAIGNSTDSKWGNCLPPCHISI